MSLIGESLEVFFKVIGGKSLNFDFLPLWKLKILAIFKDGYNRLFTEASFSIGEGIISG